MINKIKAYFRRFKDILLIVAVLATIGTSYALNEANKEITRLDKNITAKENALRIVNGQLVSQSNLYFATKGELRRARAKLKEDSSLLSDYEKKLIKMDKIVKDLNIEIDNLETIIMTGLEASDSTETMLDTIVLDKLENINVKFSPIETKHWYIDIDTIKIDATNLDDIKVNRPDISYKYRTNLNILIDRYRVKNDGTRVTFLPNWKFWLPYEYESTVHNEDPKSTITSNIAIQWE